MNTIKQLVVLAAAACVVTPIARRSNRIRAAATTLRGRTVVYRASFSGGTLYLTGCQGAFVAESTFLNPPTPAIKANWRDQEKPNG